MCLHSGKGIVSTQTRINHFGFIVQVKAQVYTDTAFLSTSSIQPNVKGQKEVVA